MNADKLINEYVRLSRKERSEFDRRYRDLLRQQVGSLAAMIDFMHRQQEAIDALQSKIKRLSK